MTDIREAREVLIGVAMEAEGCTPAMRGACEVEYGGDCACTRLADDSIAGLSEAGITLCREQVGHACLVFGRPVFCEPDALHAVPVFVPVSED